MRVLLAALSLASLLLLAVAATARDDGQWEATPGNIAVWYRNLMQPDNPTVSCCGEADSYWADSFEVQGDQYVAIITDERTDSNLGRPSIPLGTKVVVPNHKMKWDQGNPTGHGVIFIGGGGQVLCYAPPGGI